jgi:ABC-type cobalt transport system substrate-binding protein
MKQQSEKKSGRYFPVKTITVMAIIVSLVAFMSSAFKAKEDFAGNDGEPHHFIKDSVASVKAFKDVYKVLMSPRCMNCHPSGDIPLQGDDSHLHAMLPKRGKDGKGLYAMKCSNCHQPTNIAGLNKPPGHPNWHLPPASMKMVFQGRTPEQLAKQLVNTKTNGNKTFTQLIAHADDGLVKAGWNPGEGRTLPPMSHAAFKTAWITWIKTGAYAPSK